MKHLQPQDIDMRHHLFKHLYIFLWQLENREATCGALLIKLSCSELLQKSVLD